MLKTTLGVIVGVIVGAVSMALYQRHLNPSQSFRDGIAPAHTEELTRLQDKIESLESVLAGQGKARQPLVVATAKDTAPADSPEKKTPVPSQADFAERIREQNRRRAETRNAARLATLSQRLNLSPEQTERVHALLEQQTANGPALGNRIIVGSGNEDTVAANSITFNASGDDTLHPRGSGEFNSALDTLLDDTQREAYASLQQEERRNRVEAEANEELARLQRMLTLTDAQKDAAFQAFSEIARDRQDSGPSSSAAAGQRVDALRNILTPEQAKVYQEAPQVFIFGEGGAGMAATIEIQLQDSSELSPSQKSP